MQANDVGICIVTYNSEDSLPECLASIDHSRPLYVFDNNSADSSVAVVKRLFPGAHVIQNDQNIGFGAANNRLLEKLDTEFAVIVNPDAILFDDTIDLLLETAKAHPKAAIIAPVCVDDKGKIIPNFKPFEKNLGQTRSVEMVSGAFMLLRLSAFEGVFFDDKIFLYFEDDDICFQIKQKGWEILVDPRARFRHASGHSTGHSLRELRFRGYHLGWSNCYFHDKKNKVMGVENSAFARDFILKKTRHLFLKTLTLNMRNAAICYGMVRGALTYIQGKERKDSF